jgi:hypothetical protein
MTESYFKKIKEKHEHEKTRARDFTKDTIKKWQEGIKFLDHQGNPTNSLREPDNQAIILFKKAAEAEARKVSSKIICLSRPERLIKKHKLTPTDCKSLKKWQSSAQGKSRYLGLTKRARRAVVEIDRAITKEMKNVLDLYKMISPHTHCFVPPERQVHPSKLEKIMAYHLFDEQNYQNDNGYVKSDRFLIHDREDHEVNLKLYLSKRNPSLRLKFYVKNKSHADKKDILDLEAKFQGNRFLDIVHYHVVKDYTHNKLLEEEGEEDTNVPHFFELSHYLETGAVKMRHRLDKKDEEFHYTNEDATINSVKAMQLWKKFPIVAGGSLFTIALNVIANDPKYEALQFHYARC